MTTERIHSPTVICFPGSGHDPLPSWTEFVKLAQQYYTIVLYDRGPDRMSLEEGNNGLLRYLKQHEYSPPYVLIAHSYGGAFAKMLLHQQPDIVAGMVLAETGQEGGLPSHVERSLLNRKELGDKPLSVIRCNSLLIKWTGLKAAMADSSLDQMPRLQEQEDLLKACDDEDERLKRAQLGFSRVTRYVHLPDCGHNTIRERPVIVLQELQWVMANLRPEQNRSTFWTRLRSIAAAWRQ